MAIHRVHVDKEAALAHAAVGDELRITGQEAAHLLRVKRLEPGDSIELFDAQGCVARAAILKALPAAHAPRQHKHQHQHPPHARDVLVRIDSLLRSQPARPRIEVWSATPKGSRVDEMIDQLSQAGACAWVPTRGARSVVEPSDTKLERLARVALESAKQCHRPFVLEITPERPFADAFSDPNALVILADAAGDWPSRSAALASALKSAPPACLRVLIGPEGGFDDAELSHARAARAIPLRLSPHILRIETAAAIAAAALRALTAASC